MTLKDFYELTANMPETAEIYVREYTKHDFTDVAADVIEFDPYENRVTIDR